MTYNWTEIGQQLHEQVNQITKASHGIRNDLPLTQPPNGVSFGSALAEKIWRLSYGLWFMMEGDRNELSAEEWEMVQWLQRELRSCLL